MSPCPNGVLPAVRRVVLQPLDRHVAGVYECGFATAIPARPFPGDRESRAKAYLRASVNRMCARSDVSETRKRARDRVKSMEVACVADRVQQACDRPVLKRVLLPVTATFRTAGRQMLNPSGPACSSTASGHVLTNVLAGGEQSQAAWPPETTNHRQRCRGLYGGVIEAKKEAVSSCLDPA